MNFRSHRRLTDSLATPFLVLGHPEVYIAILPGMGATSHILATFARKPVFGYRAMVFAIFAIGLLGFFVWGHHMFISGMSPYSAMTFSILTLSIGVPSAVKTFNWLGNTVGRRIRFTTPMLFAIGFVSLFVAGGITGLVLGQTRSTCRCTIRIIVTAHFHLVMGVASIFGMFAATYFWFPKMFGRMMNEKLGKIHFWITFVGVYCIFVPMHTMGMVGMPRRFAQFTEYEFLKDAASARGVCFDRGHRHRADAASFLLQPLLEHLQRARKRLTIPGRQPRSSGLRRRRRHMTTFAGVLPVVYRGPYEFAVPGAAKRLLDANRSRDREIDRGGGNGHNGHKH